jgi:hypothetical protein
MPIAEKNFSSGYYCDSGLALSFNIGLFLICDTCLSTRKPNATKGLFHASEPVDNSVETIVQGRGSKPILDLLQAFQHTNQ